MIFHQFRREKPISKRRIYPKPRTSNNLKLKSIEPQKMQDYVERERERELTRFRASRVVPERLELGTGH